MRAIVCGALLALTALGCATGNVGPSPSATAAPVIFATAPASTILPATPTAIPATANPPAQLPSPFVPFGVSTSANNVVLRTGPGYLFARIAILPEGARLQALGRSPGDEWVLAQTEDNRVGWIFAKLLQDQGGDWAAVPTVQPPAVQVIRGSVQDEHGVPISGIQFSFVQGVGSQAPRNDAMTDETGTFYAFMPLNASGTWSVSYTAVACTSNTMDANCNCKNAVCGNPDPASLSLSLPMAPGDVLRFKWK